MSAGLYGVKIAASSYIVLLCYRLTGFYLLCLYVSWHCIVDNMRQKVQDAQLSQRDRAAWCVIVFAKSRRGNGETIFYGQYRSIFNHRDIIGRKICRIPWKKRKIRDITAFKVIEVGTNLKPVCDFLLVINSNWNPISYRFGVIAAYCSNFAPTRSLWLKISGTRGRFPPIIFARIVRPMNALQLCHWQFSHRCYGWGATSENRAKIDDFAPTRSLWSQISSTRGRPHQSFVHG